MVFRNLHLVIFIALIVASVFSACSDWQEQSKSSEKKSLEEEPGTKYNSSDSGNISKPELVYDKRGNIIERHAFSINKKDGSIRSKDDFYYIWDENNNLITEIKESFDKKGNRKLKNVNNYTYNRLNQKILHTFETFDTLDQRMRIARHSFKYNDVGYKIEDIEYSENNQAISRIIFNPDENGVILWEEYIQYNEDGDITDHKRYHYSNKGLEKTIDLMKEH